MSILHHFQAKYSTSLKVDFGEETLVTAVVVQGRYANGLGQEYAEYYMLRLRLNILQLEEKRRIK